VGTAIEELYPDRLTEHYENLAHHFTEGEDWERAFLYHDKASEKAAGAYANQAAAEHCRRALEIGLRLGDRLPDESRRRTEERLAGVCYSINHFSESAQAYARAAHLAEHAEDRALNLGRAAYSAFWGHDYAAADEWVKQGLSCSRSHDVAEGAAYALISRAWFASVSGGDLDSYECLLGEAARTGFHNDEVRALLRFSEGELAEWRGEYRSASAKAAEAIELARKNRLPHFVLPAMWFRGKALCCLGEYGEALGGFKDALDLAERIGDRAYVTRIHNTLGWCYAELGHAERATGHNRRSVQLAEEMVELELVPQVPELLGNGATNLAGNLIVLGELSRADETLAPVREALSQPGDPWMRWRYAMHLQDVEARLALARGNPEDALARVDAELAAARRHQARKLESRALELKARILLVMDRRQEADHCLRQASAGAQAIAYPPALWRAHALAAELARRSGDRSRAEASVARLRDLMEGLAPKVPDGELRRHFRALGEGLAADPLGTHR
jgi:tetratricopeptide (TPR) repeat protein